ncbi:MAG: cytidylate kinase-like family protein [Desulfarculaceae bacterium]|jgi:cytidylate kinase
MAVVSISRQFGAGGRTLGKMLADELGYEFLDETTLDTLAEKAEVWLDSSSVSPEPINERLAKLLPAVRVSNYLDRFLQNKKQSKHETNQHYEDLTRVVKQVAEIDNMVLLGRGSQFILEDDPRAIKILLVAEMEDRINFLRKKYDLDKGQVKKLIKRADKERSKILSRFHPSEPNESTRYHMVINTSLVSFPIAKGLVRKMVKALDDKLKGRA